MLIGVLIAVDFTQDTMKRDRLRMEQDWYGIGEGNYDSI